MVNLPATTAALAGAAVLGCTYLTCSFAHRLTAGFRRRWGSFSAGVSLAYVFIDVLPELATGSTVLSSAIGEERLGAEKRVYLIALIGLVVFVGLAQLRKLAEGREHGGGGLEPKWYFYIHGGAFALYNLLIGYLLVGRAIAGLSSLVVYVIAMALHAILIDEELVREHGEAYLNRGRGWLALCLAAGCVAATTEVLSEVGFTRLFAFLAGGIVITSAHSELPPEGDQRFDWLVVGAALYAAILLAV